MNGQISCYDVAQGTKQFDVNHLEGKSDRSKAGLHVRLLPLHSFPSLTLS